MSEFGPKTGAEEAKNFKAPTNTATINVKDLNKENEELNENFEIIEGTRNRLKDLTDKLLGLQLLMQKANEQGIKLPDTKEALDLTDDMGGLQAISSDVDRLSYKLKLELKKSGNKYYISKENFDRVKEVDRKGEPIDINW